MNIKILLGILSILITIVSYGPYLKDLFSRKTKPHVYTWLIWLITQGTAVAGIWYGGGSWGGLNLTIGLLFILVVLIFSLRFGSKNITKADTVVLIVALLAVVFWWLLSNPVLAILMVSAIDVLGYIPSFRKSFQDPWSETVITWIGFVVGDILAILALSQYNLLTLPYLVAISVANCILAGICLIRRLYIPESSK